MRGTSTRVQFRGPLVETGDYDSFEFTVRGVPSGEESTLFVRVSRSLVAELRDPGTTFLASLAAKAVEQHILGRLPKDHYVDPEGRIILLGTHWYPGHPGTPETLSHYDEFDVIPPKPPLGFKRA